MSFSDADLDKVALLARLRLTDAERKALAPQLSHILDYVRQLDELDTDGVDPLAHPLEVANVFRADEPRPSLPRDRVLSNAPKHDEACFRVPPVLGDE